MLINTLDIFSGCGGMTSGFTRSGYNIIGAVEKIDIISKTYSLNHKNVRMFGDIKKEKERLFSDFSGIPIDMIITSPPCQGFSTAGDRNHIDKRSSLYNDFIDVLEHFRPKFFVIENVKGILSMKDIEDDINGKDMEEFVYNCRKIQELKELRRKSWHRDLTDDETKRLSILEENRNKYRNGRNRHLKIYVIDKIIEKIRKLDYSVVFKTLNAVNFGVAQRRERVFIIGSNTVDASEKFFPEPFTFEPTELFFRRGRRTVDEFLKKRDTVYTRCITAYDAIDDLKDMEENIEFSHIFPRHSEKMIQRIHNVKQGKSLLKSRSSVYYRLIPDEPANTVLDNHGSNFLHYDLDRVLTPRELARIQSFPDFFQVFREERFRS